MVKMENELRKKKTFELLMVTFSLSKTKRPLECIPVVPQNFFTIQNQKTSGVYSSGTTKLFHYPKPKDLWSVFQLYHKTFSLSKTKRPLECIPVVPQNFFTIQNQKTSGVYSSCTKKLFHYPKPKDLWSVFQWYHKTFSLSKTKRPLECIPVVPQNFFTIQNQKTSGVYSSGTTKRFHYPKPKDLWSIFQLYHKTFSLSKTKRPLEYIPVVPQNFFTIQNQKTSGVYSSGTTSNPFCRRIIILSVN